MGAKWFCNKCEKEIWTGLQKYIKETETVSEMEKNCLCADCILKQYEEGEDEQLK